MLKKLIQAVPRPFLSVQSALCRATATPLAIYPRLGLIRIGCRGTQPSDESASPDWDRNLSRADIKRDPL
jgi:hypothetical protein